MCDSVSSSFHQRGTERVKVLEGNFMPHCEGTTRHHSVTVGERGQNTNTKCLPIHLLWHLNIYSGSFKEYHSTWPKKTCPWYLWNNNLLLLYSAFLGTQSALHRRGGISSSTTNVQHPPGWCNGSHIVPEHPPHTSLLVERRQSDEVNQCMRMIRRTWWSEVYGQIWAGCWGYTPTLRSELAVLFFLHRQDKALCTWIHCRAQVGIHCIYFYIWRVYLQKTDISVFFSKIMFFIILSCFIVWLAVSFSYFLT